MARLPLYLCVLWAVNIIPSISGNVTLPLGDINVLVLTDIHSWVAGHGPKEPDLNINYGDVVSFYERLYDYCDQQDKDLFFVMNGDWIDGTGISTDGDVFSLTQVLERMPWDALNVGNHELYHEKLIKSITKPGGFVDWFGDRYLSSNVFLSESGSRLGKPYIVMHGERTHVLTFGFLYNMKDHVSIVDVKTVQSVIEESWFKDALLNEEYDGILVLAHMHVRDQLVTVLLDGIRKFVGDQVPVQFVTGHTHIRSYTTLDSQCSSFEAGRYLDTVGFVSFPTKQTIASSLGDNVSSLFEHRFIDANMETLQSTLGSQEIDTPNGAELTSFIANVREKMGLTEKIGCSSLTYRQSAATYKSDSLWGLFQREVVPTMFAPKHVLYVDKGGLRYDLFEGELIRDDIIAISPFNDTYWAWTDIPGWAILEMNHSLNLEAPDPLWLPDLPHKVVASSDGNIEKNSTYHLITTRFTLDEIRKALVDVFPASADQQPELIEPSETTLWMDYIRIHSPCEETQQTKENRDKHNRHDHSQRNDHGPNGHTHGTSPATGKGKEGDDDDDGDFFVFMMGALVSVVVMGSVNVWQRSREFKSAMNERQRQIVEARAEYMDSVNEQYEYADSEAEDRLI